MEPFKNVSARPLTWKEVSVLQTFNPAVTSVFSAQGPQSSCLQEVLVRVTASFHIPSHLSLAKPIPINTVYLTTLALLFYNQTNTETLVWLSSFSLCFCVFVTNRQIGQETLANSVIQEVPARQPKASRTRSHILENGHVIETRVFFTATQTRLNIITSYSFYKSKAVPYTIQLPSQSWSCSLISPFCTAFVQLRRAPFTGPSLHKLFQCSSLTWASA